MSDDRYHYTGCGLDYVYLANGYRLFETGYGDGVAIEDADGLHEAIARHIILSPFRLRGQEVRFLRAQLDLSQEALGRIVGVSRVQVTRWEMGQRKPIPGTADRALRMFYTLKMGRSRIPEQILEVLTMLEEQQHQQALFHESNDGWHEVARAA